MMRGRQRDWVKHESCYDMNVDCAEGFERDEQKMRRKCHDERITAVSVASL